MSQTIDLEERTKNERVTTKEIFVCDQGHFGFTSCGHCHYDLNDKEQFLDYCPKCEYLFIERKVGYQRGGSDF